MKNQFNFFNINILSISLDDLLINFNKGILFTPNVDHIVRLQKDLDFLDCYKKADWVICDSKILNLGAKFLGKGLVEVIPGSSFFPAFYNFHKDNEDMKIFLLGALEGVGEIAKFNINNKVGREIIVGTYSPDFGFENDNQECLKILDLIRSTNCNVIVVGLGSPKQEKWIIKYKSQLPQVDIFMALGATIDFEAGNISRAPYFVQNLHLEWLYRLYKEPKRLWKRYLLEDIVFFKMIFWEKFKLAFKK